MVMADYLVDLRDVQFVLYEHLDVEKLLKYPKFQDFNREMFDMIIEEGVKQAKEIAAPLGPLGDEKGVKLEDGKVKLPQEFVDAYKLYCEAGWIGGTADPEWGGQGVPLTVGAAASEFFQGACFPLCSTGGLSSGAGNILLSYGTQEMKDLYLEKLFSGEWAGTMCLTEPQAGSAVGDTICQARKDGDHYKIVGTKSFISSGDHNLTENIIHMVLARTEGAPAGIKGISLFLIPKYRVNPDGSVGDSNDITVAGVEHKMGIHASPTCTLNFGDNDDCIGYLIGEECQGITYMFQMMNEARMMVGQQALGTAGTAYLNALEYTRERIQGVHITQMRNPDAPRVAIIEHPDIRRMLLMMKAFTEGMRALLYTTSSFIDIAENSEDEAERMKYHGLVELLTPICKAWPSDMGFRVTEWAIQCFGGFGYCRDYPVEQYMRDIKITSIYEGANGIQAIDLLGRKVSMKGGTLFISMLGLLGEFIEENRSHATLGENIGRLEKAKDTLAQVTVNFGKMGAGGDMVYPVLHACPYLEMFGDVVVAYLLLEQAVIAQEKFDAICKDKGADSEEAKKSLCEEDDEARFYWGKLCSADFFTTQILPRMHARAESIESGNRSALEVVF
jgi:alkylation response protein AidB-like acyl-CoA dehydrogenase